MKTIFTCLTILIFQLSEVNSQCWKQIYAGRDHCLAIHSDGTLWAWGANQDGQFGDGTNNQKLVPTKVSSATDWKQISAGEDYNLAIKNDGTLWAWGRNQYGKLGDGTNINRNSPVKIGTDTNWKQVSAGVFQSSALKNDGTVWVWGDNTYGQLGSSPTSPIPTKLLGVTNCIQVSSGRLHYAFILADGSLWSLGSNGYGQLGVGNNVDKKTPERVGNSNNWMSVSSGAFHNLALQKDGSLWSWGRGGLVGISSDEDQWTPKQITTSKDWKLVSAGGNHSMAIKNDGTLWSWGGNYEGHLGLGSYRIKKIPTQVGNESDWDYAEAGELYVSLSLKKDGSSWAWGSNDQGESGDGTKISKNVPIKVYCPGTNPPSSIWKNQTLKFSPESLGRDLNIVNENVVWFFGEAGEIGSNGWTKSFLNYTFARTINGGQDWITGVFPFNGKRGDLTHMAAIDDTTAWVTYVESVTGNFDSYTSKVYKTSDGGKTWSLANINIGSNWVNCIHFFNKSDGVIMADATSSDFNIYTTSDGGASWTKVSSAAIPDLIKNDEFGVNSLVARGDKIWFPTWAGRIFYSADKGKNWQVFNGPATVVGLLSQIDADDLGNLYVEDVDLTNDKYHFYRRNVDDGTWKDLTASNNTGSIFFSCIPGTQNIIMMDSKDIYTRISKDKGQTWSLIDSVNTQSKNTVQFFNSNTGFCITQEYRNSTKLINGTYSIIKYSGPTLSNLLSQQVLDIDVKLYPSPTVDYVTVKFDVKEKNQYNVMIHDAVGNMLLKKYVSSQGSDKVTETVDVSSFTSGIYFLTISNQMGAKSLSFIKM